MQSVGLIPNHLLFSSSNSVILHFRRALALNECRVNFIPSFCAGGKPELEETDSKGQEASGSSSNTGKTGVNGTTGQKTDVKEVFFAGAHCGTAHFPAPLQSARYLSALFQTLEVDLWQTDSITVSPAFPFDGRSENASRLTLESFSTYTDSIFAAPTPLTTTTLHLAGPDPTEIQGFSLHHIPAVIISALSFPFRWT